MFALLFACLVAPPESLDEAERSELRRYLAELKAGRPGSAETVERLAGMSYACFRETVSTYVELPVSAEAATHRAFQALLERTSREAHSPWPLMQLYTPDFAEFVAARAGANPVQDKLFEQLLKSDTGRPAFDLCVRLCPAHSLNYLASSKKEGQTGLFEAWNRRLALGKESRPLPDLEKDLAAIAKSFSPENDLESLEAHLRFVASWPVLRASYRTHLESCLAHEKVTILLAGLAVQQRQPLLLERNAGLVEKAKIDTIQERALRNYAYEDAVDHSATLRKLWQIIPAEKTRLRYQCLFAMGVHPKGNDGIALDAVLTDAYELFDVALPVLRHGAAEKARRAIAHVLKTERGHEEALRLARDLKLDGFPEPALAIALDAGRDQILRQTAMHYLQEAEGKYRRKLLPALALPKDDLRLSAILAFLPRQKLTAEDLREIGPALVRVALDDPAPGCRQEAMYVLGAWKAEQTTEFFRKLLADNPAVTLSDGYYTDQRYWQYRYRLMALLGMVKLGDAKAKEELIALHRKGGPAERMDVLLAFLDMCEVPDWSFEDLESIEPRLVATAVHLIVTHGSAEQKKKLRQRFASSALWQQFKQSGIDDYNILRMVEEAGRGK